MRWLALALLALTGLVWWTVVDVWPTLPARIPVLLYHSDPADWWVERTPAVWFVPPALGNAFALVVGFMLPRRLMRRAAAGAWLPLPRWREVQRLPRDSRLRIAQPMQVALAFAGLCLVILIGHWWSQVEGIALGTERGRQGREVGPPLAMLGAVAAAIGSASTMVRVRTAKELAAFAAAHERLRR
jgi:hypothetical protein